MPKTAQAAAWFVWPTAWGPCGAAASDAGICRLVLPHYQADDLRQLLAFEHAGAVESAEPFAELIALSREYFNARQVSFDDIACDLPSEKTFGGRVLRACRQIPYGRTRSYSQLAAAAGNPAGARATAAALARNPLPLIVPCHRVTYAGGRLGGFSAPGGVEQKRRMLEMEAAAARAVGASGPNP